MTIAVKHKKCPGGMESKTFLRVDPPSSSSSYFIYFISSPTSILYVYSPSASSSPLPLLICTSIFISTSITSLLLSTHPFYGRSIICIPCRAHRISSKGVNTAPSCMQRGVGYIEINIKPMQRCP